MIAGKKPARQVGGQVGVIRQEAAAKERPPQADRS
jgi:hypothetical protein